MDPDGTLGGCPLTNRERIRMYRESGPDDPRRIALEDTFVFLCAHGRVVQYRLNKGDAADLLGLFH